MDANPFAIGKARSRFAGYTDIITATIQAKYQQPPSLSDDLEYAVLCELVIDEQGRVLQYRLVNSSGSLLFDQSALDALVQSRRSPSASARDGSHDYREVLSAHIEATESVGLVLSTQHFLSHSAPLIGVTGS